MFFIFTMTCLIEVVPSAIIAFSISKFSEGCVITASVIAYALLQTFLMIFVAKILKARGNETIPAVPRLKE